MELRNHPLMSFQGVRNWPPQWRLTLGTPVNLPTGEVGTLEYVQPSLVDPGTCFITISHDRCNYVGEINFDHHEFCARVCELLIAKFGRSLVEIASLDIR